MTFLTQLGGNAEHEHAQADSTPPASDGALHGVRTMSDLLADRRGALGDAAKPQETWGLALSGGGIRSATFCFGLLKSLAANGLLQRFDFMSTVSGGGYVGAMVGKMFHDDTARRGREQDEATVQEALGTADSRWFAWWLRANGRYLVPRGTRDMLFAAATFGRNLVGIHIELALLAASLGVLLALMDICAWWAADSLHGTLMAAGTGLIPWFTRWPTAWLALPVPLWFITAIGSAYWILPNDGQKSLGSWRIFMLALAGLLAAVVVYGWGWLVSLGMPGAALGGMLFVVLAWMGGAILAQAVALKVPDGAVARNRLTRWLSAAITVCLAIVLLGCIDYLAWHLATTASDHQTTAGISVIVIGVAMRLILPRLADFPRAISPATRRAFASVLNIAGLMTLAALAIIWVSVIHRIVTLSLFTNIGVTGELNNGGPNFGLALLWLLLVGAPVVLVIVVSGGNDEFLNRSSLHAFYRARLTRGYLGAANGHRFGEHVRATGKLPEGQRPTQELVSVSTVHADDDVAMADYAPHLAGGPIHLINVCVNQTRDPRGGLFNQDRKGLNLTVGPGGIARVAQDPWRTLAPQKSLTLGTWTAISGAAVSPGMGHATRPGVAALAVMAGLRLGYWWKSPESAGRAPIGKYQQFLSELLGRFNGDSSASWFLTDGGHFENTAAYALLKERCRLIVVADCGADPRNSFGDLENLVRKARIDLQAEIRVLKPTGPLPDGWTAFGSLNDIVAADSSASIALARVEYAELRDQPAYMIIVKPSMCAGLPVDLVNFKADNPNFPQDSTSDQFFDEAQWESYYRLGSILGENLTSDLIEALPGVARRDFDIDDGVPSGAQRAVSSTEAAAASAAALPAAPRLPARIVTAGAVTATLSLGAIVSLGVTAWQAVQTEMQQRGAMEAAVVMDRTSLKELSDLYSKYLDVKSPGALTELAAAIVRTGELTCNRVGGGRAYQASHVMQTLLTQTQAACKTATDVWSCKEIADDDLGPAGCLAKAQRPKCMPHYWIRNYRGDASNCAAVVPAAASLQAPPAVDNAAVAAVTRLRSSAQAARDLPSAAATTAATADSGASVATSTDKPCSGQTVYVQIYGPDLRDEARALRTRWRASGASVPPIEDVWHTATQYARSRPDPVAQPSIVVHGSESRQCALRLKQDAETQYSPKWEIREQPLQLNATRGVIEAWLPPGRYEASKP